MLTRKNAIVELTEIFNLVTLDINESLQYEIIKMFILWDADNKSELTYGPKATTVRYHYAYQFDMYILNITKSGERLRYNSSQYLEVSNEIISKLKMQIEGAGFKFYSSRIDSNRNNKRISLAIFDDRGFKRYRR